MAKIAAYDRACDLECQGKEVVTSGNRHEFVGPVKIVLVESTPVDYQRKVWGSAVFTFVMLLLGTTVFTVFFFTLKFQLLFLMNVHVLLCTMGVSTFLLYRRKSNEVWDSALKPNIHKIFSRPIERSFQGEPFLQTGLLPIFQLFMTTGIMMFSSLFGGSMYLKPAERKFQHFFLEASGVFFGVVGTVFALGSMAITLHALTGFVAAVLSIASSLVGPTVYVADSEKLFGLFNKKAHRSIAVPTFILCTICFALGLTKDSFINWAPIKHLHYILLLFTFIYSGTVVMSMVLRLLYDC